MEVNKELVEKIAHLARLELSASEKAEMSQELTNILDWVDKLNEVDTTGVEPLIHMSEEMNVLREDIRQPHLSHEEALKNAPKKDSNYIRVPKVIE